MFVSARRSIYITQWYLLGAFFGFPGSTAAAQAMLSSFQSKADAGSVGLVYANNPSSLLVAIALRHRLLHDPKVIGGPVYSYHLATIGFWTRAFLEVDRMQRSSMGHFRMDINREHRGPS